MNYDTCDYISENASVLFTIKNFYKYTGYLLHFSKTKSDKIVVISDMAMVIALNCCVLKYV